ncbi:hypothetical protein ACFSJS_16235 [Streptomyces desertarenae]|uniref:Transposase n=1 Tax=Streptomyces desertarenae TaxID=2666184 RepID=A0ABW4PKD6_9ACTN
MSQRRQGLVADREPAPAASDPTTVFAQASAGEGQGPTGHVHPAPDDYATCKTPAVKTRLPVHFHSHLHFTPTGSSWPNLVERWFAEPANKRMRRGVH